MVSPTNALKLEFQRRYGRPAQVFRAPGRVNLIGEHTDYNDGFVMPAAIDLSTFVAVSKRNDRILTVYSETFSELIEFDLDALSSPAERRSRHWSDYVCGVAVTLEDADHRLCGADLMIRSEVPMGSGLSSSAAIEVATGLAMLDAADIAIDPVELALLCQRAENEFVRMRCGIMDQFISCCGKKGGALLLDCRSLNFTQLPLVHELKLVICNTMVRHELADGEYNHRRAECEEGVAVLAEFLPQVRALRDVTMADLEEHATKLSDVVYRRCRHVISENARVVQAAQSLEERDFVTFGNLMTESHRSLRDDYEVSCRELDLMARLAREVEGVYGARMMGGGFGGSTINLVRTENVESFKQSVIRAYEEATGLTPEIYICDAAEGAGRVVAEE
jgi:galactokinase